MREEISDRIIKRAVDLWCKKLRTPVFDNGDKSHVGGLTSVLAMANIATDKSKIKDIDKSIEAFRVILTDELIRMKHEDGYFDSFLSTDYHPCNLLSDAGEKAGILPSQFSCKSNVVMNEDCVTTSFGYGAEHIAHYPLSDDKWLITTLRGSKEDIQKIKNDAMGDNLLMWVIESA